MTTYADMKLMVLHALNAEAGGQYSDALILDAISGALRAILPWCSQRAVEDIDGGIDSLILPDGTFQVDGLLDLEDMVFLPNLQISYGKEINAKYISWLEYPQGTLAFTETLFNRTYRLFTRTYWPEPFETVVTDPPDPTASVYTFTTPPYVTNGLMYWACSHCIVPSSVASSQIRQFNLRVDSGVPVDNVLENSAAFLHKLFIDEMGKIPRQSIGIG